MPAAAVEGCNGAVRTRPRALRDRQSKRKMSLSGHEPKMDQPTQGQAEERDASLWNTCVMAGLANFGHVLADIETVFGQPAASFGRE